MDNNEHYYSSSPQADHRYGEITVRLGERQLRLRTDAGVFSKSRLDRGTALMLEAIERQHVHIPPRGNVCDIGCGYGPLGLSIATLHPKTAVYMVDINERAVHLTKENANLNGVENVYAAVGSGVLPFAHITFDYIVSNPPLRTGKKNVQKLLYDAYNQLNPKGRLLIVIRTKQGARSMERYLQGIADDVKEVEKGGGYRLYEVIRA